MTQHSLRKAAMAALAAFGMVAAGLFGVPAALADETPTIGHDTTVTANDDGTYTLDYSISGKPMDETIDGAASDVIVLMDTSISMYGEPWAVAKDATKNLASTLLAPGNDVRMAMVSFGYVPETRDFGGSPWTTDADAVANKVDELNLSGSTNWEGAFIDARFLIGDNPARKTYVLLVSDGVPNVTSNCKPIQNNCQLHNSGVGTSKAYTAAVAAAKELPNTQIYSIATDTSSVGRMQDLVNELNAANPVYPAEYFNGTDQASLNSAFDAVAQEVLKRFKKVSMAASLSEYVEPALSADATDPVEAATLSQNAIDAGATIAYNAEQGTYDVVFPEDAELLDTYTLSLRIRPTQAALDFSATAENHEVPTGSATVTYHLATTAGGTEALSEPYTLTMDGPMIAVEQAVTPVEPEPEDPAEPADPADPADPETPADDATPQEPAAAAEAISTPIASTGSSIAVVAIVALLALGAGAGALVAVNRRA
ncbi:vWA domain-containing protein [Bifidobacterium cuniculi]|uniref:Putative von Willebrand factor type A domain protein n=1 Tax=Bifidobacterium cuniculi TaxID=1688 RepID=A0A087B2L4_9BIFI|nr:vWA domain-containing protein [Bifidobacterium cuniculi]KFI65264.1 putative von Willebrand factor type A domain protein [Bifidobacterium cuniculi]